MRKWFGSCVWFGVLALAAATLAGYYGDRSWVLELTSHFRPHLVALCFVWLFIALFQHRPLAVTVCAGLLAANAAPLVPYVMGRSQATIEHGSPLRVMTFNMHGRGTQRAAFLDFVHAEQPQVILLTELPLYPQWLTETLGADYPYRLDVDSRWPHGLMLFSRWPIGAWQIDRSVDPGLPVFTANLCEEAGRANGQCVRFVGLHAIAPFGRLAQRQEVQAELAARLAKAAPDDRVILAGDLNMTPWAPRFQRLLGSAGLIDTALGRGVTATWMSRQPMVGLIIDHVLASADIVVQDYLVGPDLGSDHLPVIADLVLPTGVSALSQGVLAKPGRETAQGHSSTAPAP